MNIDDLHIAISTDSNYLEHAIIFIESVLDNNSDFNSVTFHVLGNDLSSVDVEKIRSYATKGNGKVNLYDMSNIRQLLGINVPNTIAITSYARIFLPRLLDESIDKVIYADVDAINAHSFSDLWSLDISSNLVAGVLDDVSLKAKQAIGLDKEDPYVNAGFLLINIKQWRIENTLSKILDFLISHDGNVLHHDQGLINAISKNRIKILDPQYNLYSNLFVKKYQEFKVTPFYDIEQINEAKKSPVFIHFTPGVVNRPWCEKCKHPLKSVYLSYRNKTEYGANKLKVDNRPFKLKFLAWSFYNFRTLYYLILSLRSLLTKNKI